jgi:[acyl-carrier-protein] S-malonyltransferase
VKLAFLFPGQGMQEPSMTDVLSPGGVERKALEQALGSQALRALERGGPQLERTDVMKTVLVAVGLAVASRLAQAGVVPSVVAGHSVGEIAALAAAGGTSFEAAIGLAAARGRLMAREAARRPGGMLALLDASANDAEAAVALGAQHGVIGLAAVNAPDQYVLAGQTPCLDAVAAQFPSRRLPVAGAWHCNLMEGALADLLGELRALRISPLRAAFVVNRTGQQLEPSDDVCSVIAGQLVRPVSWVASIATLESLGVTDVITLGPGRILRGLIRKNSGTRLRVHTTDVALEQTVERLKGACRG